MVNRSKTQKKTFNLKRAKTTIFVVVCGLLAVSSIFMTIEGAASGVEIAKLEKKELQLIDEKRMLEESLVKNLSVGELQEKSTELGFAKPTNLVYISGTESVAKLPF